MSSTLKRYRKTLKKRKSNRRHRINTNRKNRFTDKRTRKRKKRRYTFKRRKKSYAGIPSMLKIKSLKSKADKFFILKSKVDKFFNRLKQNIEDTNIKDKLKNFFCNDSVKVILSEYCINPEDEGLTLLNEILNKLSEQLEFTQIIATITSIAVGSAVPGIATVIIAVFAAYIISCLGEWICDDNEKYKHIKSFTSDIISRLGMSKNPTKHMPPSRMPPLNETNKELVLPVNVQHLVDRDPIKLSNFQDALEGTNTEDKDITDKAQMIEEYIKQKKIFEPLKKGYLDKHYKQIHGKESWHPRYFVLYPNKLQWSETHEDKSNSKQLILTADTIIEKVGHGIILKSPKSPKYPKKTLQIQPRARGKEVKDEIPEWVEKIEEAIDKIEK